MVKRKEQEIHVVRIPVDDPELAARQKVARSQLLDILARQLVAEVMAELKVSRTGAEPLPPPDAPNAVVSVMPPHPAAPAASVAGRRQVTRAELNTAEVKKKIPLARWAELHYDPPPSAWTLRQWVRAAQIVPAPEKVGKGYYVSPEAKRITDSTPTGAMAEFLNSRSRSP